MIHTEYAQPGTILREAGFFSIYIFLFLFIAQPGTIRREAGVDLRRDHARAQVDEPPRTLCIHFFIAQDFCFFYCTASRH